MNEIREMQNKLRLAVTKELHEIVDNFGVSPEIIGKMVDLSARNIYRYLGDILIIPWKEVDKFETAIFTIKALRITIHNQVISWRIEKKSIEAQIFSGVFFDPKMARIFNLENKTIDWKIKRLLNIVLKRWTDQKGD